MDNINEPLFALGASELVLNEDGSMYHLNILPDEIADIILLVGDPARVARISQFFDSIDCIKSKREFVTHTGTYNGVRITAMSSGIGTENIDIVINELDALVNIDLKQRTVLNQKKSLKIIRLGTCGSLNPDIPVDSLLISEKAVGLDGLLHFYPEYKYTAAWASEFYDNFPYSVLKPFLYFAEASTNLISAFSDADFHGITATLPGFYAPQGRGLRTSTLDPDFLERLNNLGVINFEMETSAIYGLSTLLGHQCLTVNCVVANRRRQEFAADHYASERKMIEYVLQKVHLL